jgi:hypothetical protein
VVLNPRWALIPVLARYDIGMTVAVEVGHGAGFVCATVDQAAFKWDLGGSRSGPGRERHQ